MAGGLKDAGVQVSERQTMYHVPQLSVSICAGVQDCVQNFYRWLACASCPMELAQLACLLRLSEPAADSICVISGDKDA